MIKIFAFLLMTALIAFAHHPLFAAFDSKLESEYRATVVSLEWGNPHWSFHANVARDSGEAAWIFELPGPSGLLRAGWNRDSVRGGDVITIHAFPAKDGSARASVRYVVLSVGRTIVPDHPFNYQH